MFRTDAERPLFPQVAGAVVPDFTAQDVAVPPQNLSGGAAGGFRPQTEMSESFFDNLTERQSEEDPRRDARRLAFAQTCPAGPRRLGTGAANTTVAGQAACFHS
jgi:hypothetical protein